ncbi:RadC family protein [Desulforhopalus sp. 52FAK]
MDKKEWQNKGAGHRGRLRDRFLETGIDGFSNVEILELLLSFGTPRSDCKEAAKALLVEYGSFSKVLDAPASSLQKVKGIGPKNSFALRFIQAVASHYLKDRISGKRYLHSSKEVADYLVHSMRGLKIEVLTVLFLDSSHAIIDSEIVSEGTLNVNTIYPREIIKRAMDHHAAAIILAHNHPSGSLKPSKQDIKLTKTLFLLCQCMQIQLLDHLIIGDGTLSFADENLMSDIREQCNRTLASLSSP